MRGRVPCDAGQRQTVVDTSAQYSAVVAQVVPVLLLAAVAVPLQSGDEPASRARAFGDVFLTALLVGAALIAEFAALFGVVRGGLTAEDQRLLSWLLAITIVLGVIRLIAPVARGYAAQTGIPAARVWRILGAAAGLSGLGLLYVVNTLTR